MPRALTCYTLLLGLAAFSFGCAREETPPTASAPAITWLEEGVQHEGALISLGYRGALPSAGGDVEPVVSIIRDGKSVAGAMVFCSLVAEGDAAEDKQPPIAAEVATVYEPAPAGMPAVYAQGKLPVPAGGAKAAVRYRIVLPGVEEAWTRDVPLPQ